jgi:membrane protease YdiL (CAAX protease family)
MRNALSSIAGVVEITLALIGCGLLWKFVMQPAARAHPPISRLPAWDISMADFLSFLLLVMGGSSIAAIAAGFVGKLLPFRGDTMTVFSGAFTQLGLLLGVLTHRILVEKKSMPRLSSPRASFTAGVATFLVAIPLVIASAKLSELLLQLAGLPTEKQDLIGMFAQADSAGLIIIMTFLAVVIAPVSEELVFRGGLFRHFRTRLPRWAALVIPGLFFASLHVNWHTLQGLSSLAPLTVLSVIFSLAYERTGKISTAIFAHALFNLNTILLIFCGTDL